MRPIFPSPRRTSPESAVIPTSPMVFLTDEAMDGGKICNIDESHWQQSVQENRRNISI